MLEAAHPMHGWVEGDLEILRENPTPIPAAGPAVWKVALGGEGEELDFGGGFLEAG